MARAPYNVHVFLYRFAESGEKEYAIFRRSDDEVWQGICGGGEDNETIIESALRESYEEAGISQCLDLHRLDTISFVPANVFKASEDWGKDVVVVPMYFFGALYDGNITLSHEHSEYKWCNCEEARKLMYWHEQKNALWELNERLERGILIR